ncbi:hypothetical protein JCM16163A_38130 [Paenibacillus sp. YK5]|uniref:Uncharacterized protein n=1 Tax=Paenibacillus naphthalenovorans TaxID=162209 RepID=A0A0U2KYJ5_9BACL|nr:hypothetical protein IJ22_16260 [Paenibacillus naphthalenovorans]SDJ23938.1 hypothetical protein SAMN05421868_12134 [Paenibacillus naphthalenovorans]
MPRQLNALMVPSLRKAFFEGGSFPDGDHAFDDHADHKNDSPVSSVIGPAVPRPMEHKTKRSEARVPISIPNYH